MDIISRIRMEQFVFGDMIRASFDVWLRSLWAVFKMFVILSMFSLALLLSCVVAVNFMPLTAWAATVPVIYQISVMALGFLVMAFIFVTDDIVNRREVSVIEAMAGVLRSIHKVLAVSILVAIAFTIPPLLLAVILRSPLILLPLELLMFVLYFAVGPYLYFFPMAIYIRGAGVIDSIKYSYYMVQGRWLKVFGWFLGIGIIGAGFFIGFLLLMVAAYYLFANGIMHGLPEKFIMAMMNGSIFSLAATIISISSVFVCAFVLSLLLIYDFWITACTVAFLNLEVRDKPLLADSEYDDEDGHIDYSAPLSVSIPPDAPAKQPHEITEMFKNIKPVDVNVTSDTERRTAMGRQNREEALRAFKKDDQITFPPVAPSPKQTAPSQPTFPRMPQDIAHPAPATAPQAEENKPASPAPLSGMPTITVRHANTVEKPLGGFPSIYKPEDNN